MAEAESRPLTIDDDERLRLHTTWSRTRKRLIGTVTTTRAHAEVELRTEQVRGSDALPPEDDRRQR